jgi:hypothetical protein
VEVCDQSLLFKSLLSSGMYGVQNPKVNHGELCATDFEKAAQTFCG